MNLYRILTYIDGGNNGGKNMFDARAFLMTASLAMNFISLRNELKKKKKPTRSRRNIYFFCSRLCVKALLYFILFHRLPFISIARVFCYSSHAFWKFLQIENDGRVDLDCCFFSVFCCLSLLFHSVHSCFGDDIGNLRRRRRRHGPPRPDCLAATCTQTRTHARIRFLHIFYEFLYTAIF